MKVITESMVRSELKNGVPEIYKIPEGKLLSPAAREYLQQCKVRIDDSRRNQKKNDSDQCRHEHAVIETSDTAKKPEIEKEPAEKLRFVDYDTGAYYYEKPEHMTHLMKNKLVPKDHPRIVFRGKLDSLQASVVLMQAELAERKEPEHLIEDLQDILVALMEMMRCDVMGEPFTRETILGLTHEELRERSHNPMKFYQIQAMLLPNYTMGKTYAMLNQLRASVRETEVVAAQAFHEGRSYSRADIIQELNRMSSAVHIMMCKYMAGEYMRKA